MARPREFDEATVLEAAMNRFWAQGYGLTSVRDLAAQMGIHRRQPLQRVRRQAVAVSPGAAPLPGADGP